MTFICRICGEERMEMDRSYEDVCIYCDIALTDDANKDNPQLF